MSFSCRIMNFRSLRNLFFAGLITALPLVVTFFVLKFILDRVGFPASNLLFWFVDDSIRARPFVPWLLSFLAILVVLAFITVLGFVSRYLAGKAVIRAFERVMDQLPFVNTVYRTVKQIVDTLGEQKKAVFQEVVLLEYPRKNCWVIGFLTSRTKGEVQARTGAELVNVFVPTTPNPTSGFLLMLPQEDVIILKMSVSDGMKLIISGGAVTPPYPTEVKAIETGEKNPDN